MNPVLAPISAATPPLPQERREQLAEAAKQFEAIFVRQMLAEARKTQFGGSELLGGQGMETFRQMQDERFADIAAERGSFGLAKMIEAQLARQVAPDSPSRLREGPGVGESIQTKHSSSVAHPQPLPQAGGEFSPSPAKQAE